MTDDGALFQLAPGQVLPPRSRTARRTVAQRFLISVGLHPLSLVLRRTVKLHIFGRPAQCRCERGLTPPSRCPLHSVIRAEPSTTCGTCVYLGKLDLEPDGRPNPSALKCWKGAGATETRRVSRGEATTVRRWWPACVDYEPGDYRLDNSTASQEGT